jgi:hypothetical protein
MTRANVDRKSGPVVKGAKSPAPARKTRAKAAAHADVSRAEQEPKTTAKGAATKEPAAKTRHKLVRDSFTIPKSEYAVLESLKLRAAKLARPSKKSELLRAGICALRGMSDRDFLAALGAVPSLKTGRPKGVRPDHAGGESVVKKMTWEPQTSSTCDKHIDLCAPKGAPKGESIQKCRTLRVWVTWTCSVELPTR